MSAWFEVLVVAFTAQLLVLPGEKGQVVIAGLATRYNPWAVVVGAATAFGGWTVLEILLGNALKGALPAAYLDWGTALLFVLFAAWILHSSPKRSANAGSATTDGGTTDEERAFVDRVDVLPRRFRGYVPAFLLMAVGEFGDKTQLVTIGLAATYGATTAIWLGEMLAIVPVSAVNAFFFHRFSHRLDLAWVHRVAAATFLLFAADIVATYLLGVSFLPF